MTTVRSILHGSLHAAPRSEIPTLSFPNLSLPLKHHHHPITSIPTTTAPIPIPIPPHAPILSTPRAAAPLTGASPPPVVAEAAAPLAKLLLTTSLADALPPTSLANELTADALTEDVYEDCTLAMEDCTEEGRSPEEEEAWPPVSYCRGRREGERVGFWGVLARGASEEAVDVDGGRGRTM